MRESTDQVLLFDFQTNPDEAFQRVFDAYYSLVCSQIYKVLGQPSDVEDVAQEIFYELWKKRHQLEIKSSLPAYLKKMAHTRTLNFIRNKKMRWKESDEVLANEPSNDSSMDERLAHEELDQLITQTVNELPPKCRTVFALSRYEELSNKEIATKLDISIKTVENQITRALKGLKSAISHYRLSK